MRGQVAFTGQNLHSELSVARTLFSGVWTISSAMSFRYRQVFLLSSFVNHTVTGVWRRRSKVTAIRFAFGYLIWIASAYALAWILLDSSSKLSVARCDL